jgi:hypothetical protein
VNETHKEIYRGRAYRKAKVVILCDGEKHWQRLTDGSRRYDGKCHDAKNCPNHEMILASAPIKKEEESN